MRIPSYSQEIHSQWMSAPSTITTPFSATLSHCLVMVSMGTCWLTAKESAGWARLAMTSQVRKISIITAWKGKSKKAKLTLIAIILSIAVIFNGTPVGFVAGVKTFLSHRYYEGTVSFLPADENEGTPRDKLQCRSGWDLPCAPANGFINCTHTPNSPGVCSAATATLQSNDLGVSETKPKWQ